MSCDRCIDIHKSQQEGKSGKSCDCSCHDACNYSTTTATNPFYDMNGTTNTLDFRLTTGTQP